MRICIPLIATVFLFPGLDVFCYDDGTGNCMTRGRGVQNAASFSTGVCASGKSQSPIDIPPPSDPKHANLILNAAYYKTHDFRIVNNHGLTRKTLIFRYF